MTQHTSAPGLGKPINFFQSMKQITYIPCLQNSTGGVNRQWLRTLIMKDINHSMLLGRFRGKACNVCHLSAGRTRCSSTRHPFVAKKGHVPISTTSRSNCKALIDSIIRKPVPGLKQTCGHSSKCRFDTCSLLLKAGDALPQSHALLAFHLVCPLLQKGSRPACRMVCSQGFQSSPLHRC